jgi:hypothetical protein
VTLSHSPDRGALIGVSWPESGFGEAGCSSKAAGGGSRRVVTPTGRLRMTAPGIHFASALQGPLWLAIMPGKYTVRIDTDKQVRNLL